MTVFKNCRILSLSSSTAIFQVDLG